MAWEIRQGDWVERLRELEDESVHCVVTSPPYWGLRDYGVDGQIGLERTPEEYISRMVEGFREVRRVLREDGTLRLKTWEADRLRHLIRNMSERSAIFKLLRDELRRLGRWKNLPRGKRWTR